jgi:pseudouridine synthase
MIRLNKFIAAAGIASRRQADLLIQQGQVRVNGKTVTGLGMQVDPQSDLITVGSQVIRREQAVCYLILHKPQGYLTTVRDPFGRPTVMDLLPQLDSRVYPVGRLDYDTSGLLFFTNDGALALALTHPRHLVTKEYLATVRGIPTKAALRQLAAGIVLEDGPTAPAKIGIKSIVNGNAIISITIREGRKRQVKRMLQAIDHPVTQLRRIAMGP